ncbi:MAG: NADH-quinone oxidoreductase subunit A [Coriobacteriia bacterium]
MVVAAWVFTGFLLVGVALAYILVTLPRFLAPHSSNAAKDSTYECGELPVGAPWVRYRVAYYIFAIIFVVFDVETVFLYPWAVIMRKLGMYGFVEMAVFVGILVLGLAYAWRKGALEWS